jgi:deoxyribose-phosphate aldolase
MVLAVGALKSGDVTAVENDIRRVTGLGLPVKVILETGLLSAEEIRLACRISIRAGAAYVKTGTGFGGQVATIETVRLLAQETRGRVKVKASGGIRTLADLTDMVAAGADRIGTSRGVQIVEAYLARG